jgi:hypothetical protein
MRAKGIEKWFPGILPKAYKHSQNSLTAKGYEGNNV